MSHTSILAGDSTIQNFISKICPPFYFSEPARKHIANFIIGASQKGYHGKITDIVDLGFVSCHRTTFGHFLSKGVWDESFLWKIMKNLVLTAVKKAASFAQGLCFTRKEVKGNLIAWIYKQSRANVPLSKILERLKAA